MSRCEFTYEQWEVIQPILPKRTVKTGRPLSDPRLMLNGILWILRTGSLWRDLPERLSRCRTVYAHFAKWRASGAYDRILEAPQIRLDADGAIDWVLWCIDGSSVWASRAAAEASKKAGVVTRTSHKTTPWAARGSDSEASSMWLLTVGADR